jgi:hypothetical protein
MLMVIIINKKGYILCQKDGSKVHKNGGRANLEAAGLLLLFNMYEMWSNNRVYRFCRGKIELLKKTKREIYKRNIKENKIERR